MAVRRPPRPGLRRLWSEAMTAETIRSVCPYCGVGCGIVMEVENDRITRIRGDADHPANGGRLCTKGSSCDKPINTPARLTGALSRPVRGGAPVPLPMDAAIAGIAERLRALIERHGPDAIALYVSGQMSIEAQYLANKLAKGYLRTQHIESNSRLCMASAGAGYKLSLGADAPPGSYEDFEAADLFFVIGANMADCHPILFLRLLERKRAGAKLIVVDPRRTATADKADLFLQIRSGTDLALLNGLLHILVRDGAIDADFIAACTSGFGAMPDFLAPYTPAHVAGLTGLAAADIETAARWIGEANAWMSLWTMGLNQSVAGTFHTNALCNLHLATGAICRPGAGPFSLTGQPNAMGGREMGYMGAGLPGQRVATRAEDRAFTEAQWNLPEGTIRAEAGLGTIGLFDAMARGEIRALWVICTNPVASVANRGRVIEALEKAELIIVQDAYADTETGAYADILLPGALWAEGDGVQVSSDRTLTLARKAVPAPGSALPDWQIIAKVACALGYGDAFAYESAAEVFAELSRFANPETGYDLRGISHERLLQGPVQWPSPPQDAAARHPIRYVDPAQAPAPGRQWPWPHFPKPDGRALFHPCPYLAADEQPGGDYPFLLDSGRLQHQWHTLTKTGRVDSLNRLNPGSFVELNPDDAARLGISAEQPVRIRSRRGEAILPARLSDRVAPGTCFAPFHWNDRFGPNLAVNALTGDCVDPISLQPGFKLCAVALEAVAPSYGHNSLRAFGEKEPAVQAVAASGRSNEQAMMKGKIETLANLLGVSVAVPEDFSVEARLWLGGFLAGVAAGDSGAETHLPVVPDHAPLTPGQRLHFDGMLAGLFSRSRPEATSDAFGRQEPIQIFWASQTGRAETLAGEIARWLQEAGHRVLCSGLEERRARDLLQGTVLFVVSTFGDGEAPDNGAPFWNALLGRDDKLSGLSYAVIALGDSSYANFCGFGRALDGRLSALGATAILPRLDCEPDYEEDVEDWRGRLLTHLAKSKAGQPPAEALAPATAVTITASSKGMSAVEPKRVSRDHPVTVSLCLNRRLSGSASDKETRLIGFDLSGTGLSYQPGDALGVWPVAEEASVECVLEALGLPGDTPVMVRGFGEIGLREALRHRFDLSRPAPALLQRLGRADGKQGDKHGEAGPLEGHVLDLLRDVRLQILPADVPVLFRRQQPRLYSIASSPLAMGQEVHLTVGVVRGAYPGTCSTFLADRAGDCGASIFVQPSLHFRLPEASDTPIIMIGPGTGIAPFRGFLHHRQAQGAKGRSWLFFGERHAASDFYYQEELAGFLASRCLTRLDTAFSRDQTERIYVQDRMMAAGADLWKWLEQGAYVYVCGDAAHMARDVDAVLRRIVVRHGAMADARADEYVVRMGREGRYRRDVY